MDDAAREGNILVTEVGFEFGDLCPNVSEGGGAVKRLAWFCETVHRRRSERAGRKFRETVGRKGEGIGKWKRGRGELNEGEDMGEGEVGEEGDGGWLKYCGIDFESSSRSAQSGTLGYRHVVCVITKTGNTG